MSAVLPKNQRLFLSNSSARFTNAANGGSNGNNGKTPSNSSASGGNRSSDSGKTTTTCPKCGDPCLVMQPFACMYEKNVQSIYVIIQLKKLYNIVNCNHCYCQSLVKVVRRV